MEDFDYGRDWNMPLGGMEDERCREFALAKQVASEFKRVTGTSAKAVIERSYARIMVQCDDGWCWLDAYRGNLLMGHIEWNPTVGIIVDGAWDSLAKWELWNARYALRVAKRDLAEWKARVAEMRGESSHAG